MSRAPKPKRLGVKALLELMGADPNECPPCSLKEARQLAPEVARFENEYCPISGKVMYSSEGACRKAITNRINKGSNVSKLRSYLCPDCSHYHMSASFHTR